MAKIQIQFRPTDKYLNPLIGVSYDVSYSESYGGPYISYITNFTGDELNINDIITSSDFLFFKISSDGCNDTIIKIKITEDPVPLTINWELQEGDGIDYVDANMRIYVNEMEELERFTNDIGLLNVFSGDVVRVQYFYLPESGGVGGLSPSVTDPVLQLLIDDVIIESHPIEEFVSATYNYTFTITNNVNIHVRGIDLNMVTPTPTPTPTVTPTPTITPTVTPTPSGNIYISTVSLTVCSDFCISNYNIPTLTTVTSSYDLITIGDVISGVSVSGFYAVSNVITDTTTGPFKIVELSSDGTVLSAFVCSGSTCVPI